METTEILEYIFGEELKAEHLRPSSAASSSSLENCSSFRYLRLSDGLDEALEAAIYHGQDEGAVGPAEDCGPLDCDNREGRLGPSVVRFDMSTHVGLFVMDRDRLNLISHSNFSSIRANVCLYQGKWQYEVQLGSKGVMQVGWATANCTFSQESGVGDTAESFAYDGNRQRKWNVRTGHYGEPWLGGDIIGCTLDLQPSSSNCGTVEFFRNGHSMGVAFSDVPMGRGAAYFPAVSMAFSESLVANFGATPFRHPIPGFEPIQQPPRKKLAHGQVLLQWLSRLICLLPGSDGEPKRCKPVISGKDSSSLKVAEKKPGNAPLLWAASLVMDRLGPLLSSAFVVQAVLVPFMEDLIGGIEEAGPCYHLSKLLDLFWTFLEEHEITPMMENVALSLLCSFRTTPSPQQAKEALGSSPKSNYLNLFKDQHRSLNLLLELTRHQQTRRHLLHHVFFSRIGFFSFINMKPLDDEALMEIVKEPWFDRAPSQSSISDVNEGSSKDSSLPPDDEKSRMEYMRSIHKIERSIHALEKKQIEFLKLLMANDDGTASQPSSRHIFLKKFHKYLEEIFATSRQLIPMLVTPVTTSVCLFQRLVSVFQSLWDEEVCQENYEAEAEFSKSLDKFFVPGKFFYDGSIDLFGSDRLGGVPSHLMKQFREELIRADVPQDVISSQSSTSLGSSSSGASSRMSSLVNLFQRRLRALGVERGAISEGALPVPSAENVMDNPLDMQSNLSELLRGFLTPIRPMSGIDARRRRRMRIGLLDMDDSEEKEENLGVGPVDKVTSLVDLFNSSVLLYQLEAHKQLCRISSIHEIMQEYASSLKMANARLEACRLRMKKCTNKKDMMDEMQVEKELIRSVEVFERKLKSQARDLAWVKSCIFSKSKQFQVAWMLRSVLRTLQEASTPVHGVTHRYSRPTSSTCPVDEASDVENKKRLFAFVPDYYLDALVGLCTALRSYFHPTAPIEDVEDHEELLYRVGLFLCEHFHDPRIVHASSKDTLVQALAAFVCAPPALRALERVPEVSLEGLVRSLLRPYENCAWAQSNFILVRIWQGNGFAFRHARSPHLRNRLGPRLSSPDGPGLSGSAIEPCPSPVFQRQVGKLLKSDEPLATAFINSLLNQLNWAFSEFIGMLQEFQNAAGRTNTQVFIESRELKICAACFELALSLLRVLEMVTVVAPQVFTDASRASSDLLLSRLCQLLCQVLNRVACAPGSGNTTAIGPGCFSHVVSLDISELEAVDHFPMLAAVAGVLLGLLTPEVKDESHQPPPKGSPLQTVPRVTEAILSEPSFQIGSLYFLLGGQAAFEEVDEESACGAASSVAPTPSSNTFSFANYPTSVSTEEIRLLKDMVNWLTVWQDALSNDADSKTGIPEEELCTICYAFPATAIFYPCKHASCRCCIVHHLMNHKECFFCKATIESVVVEAGGHVIHGKAPAKSKGD
ncbi:E3 ubiquitin-protein ligase RNF123-like isoform X2 [Ischnura elegans]|uniref:E3 ubiquitin-protein ligase RNF123-like isoform X2 n=1 Tax=Ischnura elegans TaxID=197161 RepID=UPI001ED8935F|nr:E3 ubiquitin-protein ligase RNF123-like isoform X2 [Ischnura elegans]